LRSFGGSANAAHLLFSDVFHVLAVSVHQFSCTNADVVFGLTLEARVQTGLLPAVLEAPRNQVVLAGQPVTLMVRAGGCEPLAYQWQCNGTDIPGATHPRCAIAQAQASHSGDYRVIVWNPLGTNQASARLDVVDCGPVIAVQPQAATNALGDTYTFEVGAIGIEPLRYQWLLNGAILPGATNATLTLANIQTNDYGTYSVLVASVCDAVTSQDALLLPWNLGPGPCPTKHTPFGWMVSRGPPVISS